jgi:hypothetical protein
MASMFAMEILGFGMELARARAREAAFPPDHAQAKHGIDRKHHNKLPSFGALRDIQITDSVLMSS